MGLEHVGLERDRALVQRLRLGNLISRVMDIGEVDQGRHEVRINLQRTSICGCGLLHVGRIAIVEDGCREEKLLRRGGFRLRHRIHEGRKRRQLAPLELEHLCRLRLNPEIERQLTRARCEEVAQHGPEGRALSEGLIGLSNDREIGECVIRFAVCASLWPDQSPLLHVAEMIFADVLVAFEQLTS